MNIASLLAGAGQAAQTAVRSTPGEGETAQRLAARKQAVEFESVYLAEMLKPMFDGVKGSAEFESGTGQDMWRSMQVQEFGKAIAGNGGIGIADTVTEELLRAQEAVQEKRI